MSRSAVVMSRPKPEVPPPVRRPPVPVYIDFNAVCAGINWEEFQSQKKVLYALQGVDRQGIARVTEREGELLEGLINFVETLQDVAEGQKLWAPVRKVRRA